MQKSTRSILTFRALPPPRQSLCTISFSLLAATPAAQAATATWSATPADAVWSNTANWSASPVPGLGDTATFGGASTQTTINTGTISLTQIAVTSTTGYTIGTSAGTGSITFADGTTTALNNSGQTNTTINANIILGSAVASNTTFTSGVNRTTTLAGSITGGTGGTAAAKILTLSPTSNASSVITISGAISDGGASSLALSKGGSGTVNLTNANNSFTGGLTVLSGTVNVSSLGALGSATTGLITLGFGNQSPGTLNFTGSPGSLSRQVQIGSGTGGSGGATINNNATNDSNPLIFTNAVFNAQISNGNAVARVLTLGGANTDANEIQGVIRNNTGSGAAVALMKADAGTWTLSGANTYAGATTVTAGKLIVTNTIANSAVTVSGSGAILATDAAANIGSTLTVNNGAILAVGDAANATTATATVTNATTFNNGSIFSWDINAAGTSSSYDKLVTTSVVGEVAAGDAVFRIVVADTSFGNSFWTTNRTWADIFTTDGSAAIADWATVFGNTVTVVNSSYTSIAPTTGTFSISGGTLTWTAVPEPTSALAGLLIGAGLLGRRRH